MTDAPPVPDPVPVPAPERVGPWILARTFNRIALESFGGGLSAWSREVIVIERGWLDEDEFLSASTLCRVMPGANQVNLALFVGMRMAGLPGAAGAVAGLLAAPALLVLLLGSLYGQVQHVPAVRSFLAGMAAAAVGLTVAVAWEQARKVLRSPVAVLLALGTGAAAVAHFPLTATLLVLGPAGFAWAWLRRT